MADPVETFTNLLLPEKLIEQLEAGEGLKPQCPAAEAINLDGQPAILCKIEKHPLPFPAAALAIGTFCCAEYTDCPSWQADYDNDPVVKRTHDAIKNRAAERRAREEIERGVRNETLEEREAAQLLEEELKIQAREAEEREEA
jgi:hypothetical protein